MANFLTEPVYGDGKATGEVRVYRIWYPRTFRTIPSSEIPWDMVLPTKDAADERVRKEYQQ